jgi:hypothetical protein
MFEFAFVFHSFARLEQTCNNPHHGISPDRNRVEIIGVDLPAFLLSKNGCPDPVRAPQHSAEALFDCFSSKPPNNKKPGVERRAKSPVLATLRVARLDTIQCS